MSDDGNQRPIPTGLTFHITPKEVWEAQKASGSYQPEAFVDEGFVHTTNDLEKMCIRDRRRTANSSSTTVSAICSASFTRPIDVRCPANPRR